MIVAMTQIRAMTARDVPSVSRLLGESWRRTYSPIMGPETTARLSDDRHAPERLAAELLDDNKMSFVAERPDGSISGYALADFPAVLAWMRRVADAIGPGYPVHVYGIDPHSGG